MVTDSVRADGIANKFSMFQITLRLQRVEDMFFLNKVMRDKPPQYYLDVEDRRREAVGEPCHVYIHTIVENIPAVEGHLSQVSIKLHCMAFWRDERMVGIWKEPNRLLKDHGMMWYPKLELENNEAVTRELDCIRLLDPKTGLLQVHK